MVPPPGLAFRTSLLLAQKGLDVVGDEEGFVFAVGGFVVADVEPPWRSVQNSCPCA